MRQAEAIILAEGFTAVTMDELAQRLGCSKATLYSLAATKEQLVLAVTRAFFRDATAEIEQAVQAEPDPRQRIRAYLAGVGTAMRRHSHAFYDDMVGYEPTAQIYRKNSAAAAAQRVHEMIEEGVQTGVFRALNGQFAAQVVAVTIDAVQSGALLESTGLTAGDAFSELGDLLLDGLSTGQGAPA
ncbi:TetR/AcrR family transcriptional regulator [Streptomyces caniscabiei]|uniref:TetR/AcrR family transcriptional regulator n=1 Tax=Streptomyces caniscabiei TaxID=2746961 RepID=UPI0029B891AD|nr:TetR/AcrR family transcriptional regulator [Streptomyces caniscabiei]MDX2605500.1 TetR/AcrR family transcriptional regulator [Streptomyces caniscabiei]MDX2735889.1 TetR/AcrR family transcriptional regulator [Streptomyces caniscabiei]MDX2782902.1 TetR/AcrR family transcriptional regulator [Streptomyces caniscabiei]